MTDDLQLILAHQNLRSLPDKVILEHALTVEYLDLSGNHLRHLNWLYDFVNLKHLVLDSNALHEAHLRTLNKPLEQLEVLMLNKNEFSDLQATVKHLKRLFPNLIYLSLHGNPICPDGLELTSFSSYASYDYDYYRTFILESLSKLKFLDHCAVERVYKYESFATQLIKKGTTSENITSSSTLSWTSEPQKRSKGYHLLASLALLRQLIFPATKREDIYGA